MVWSQIFPFLPRIRVARAPFPIFLDYPGTLASGFGHLPVGASSDLLTNENVDIQNLILKSQGGLTWRDLFIKQTSDHRVKFYPQQFIEYTGSVCLNVFLGYREFYVLLWILWDHKTYNWWNTLKTVVFIKFVELRKFSENAESDSSYTFNFQSQTQNIQ